MTILAVARDVLLALEIALALPLAYLLALAVGAAIGTIRHSRSPRRKSNDQQTMPASTFAILVPAHNEELLIGKTLRSLAQLDYPTDRYAIHVIADNCTDRTAEIAAAAGVHVHERTNATEHGKGHALAWAFDRLMHGDIHYDAYVVLDADSVVDPALLTALSRGLARGALALQSHNAVLNAAESATSALRWLALSLMNYIRPLGRNTWGGSSTLTGNGMCLTHEMLTRHPWQAFGLSEDYQYYLLAVASGEKVLFVPDANVRSVMPTTARQLQSQDIRWESLNPDASSMQRDIALRLLREGIRYHSWIRLDALAELMTPPLSVLASSSAVLLIATIALGAPLQIVLAALLAGALFAYVCSAFVLLRPPWGVYRSMIHAPAYMSRKLWVYIVLRRLRKNTTTWVRTSRTV
ncbi:MAG TPA: glycosyltransferase family 2 protein [Ktedonobacterales bacterium]|nr:glycosyltransferase family 2 protein [Ktedonobacterales bacterium]